MRIWILLLCPICLICWNFMAVTRAVDGSWGSLSKAATSWLPEWCCKWVPTSEDQLAAAEKKILSHLKTPFESKFVTLPPDAAHKSPQRVWTVSFNSHNPTSSTPLVLVHGFAGGVALWALNLDALAARRPVYAFDMLGFGQSSRPDFSSNPDIAEQQFVDSFEAWRKEMNLTDFILLGHSFGGFLSASYCLRHSAVVKHLILVDPWGLPERPSQEDVYKQFPVPRWFRAALALSHPFNPLAALRAAGPWGPGLIARLRPDFQRKFATLIEEEAAVLNYIYHCNAQSPTGERAFKSMAFLYGWAKNGLLNRMKAVDDRLPISFVYGSQSWIDHSVAYEVKGNRKGKTEVKLISGAGHHVYADRAPEFNDLVNNICRLVDAEQS